MNLVILGDIHANFEYIQNMITNYHKLKNTNIIQLGDFGIGFKNKKYYDKILNEFSDKLKENNNIMYVLRGNHDDPEYFNGNYNFSNLKFIKDCSIIDINGYKTLFLGGAHSIDRVYRMDLLRENKIVWWSNENLCSCDIGNIQHIDIIVSHTGPKLALEELKNDNLKKWFEYDPHLEQDLINEQLKLSRIFYQLKDKGLKHWFFGHFHGNLSINKNVQNIENVKIKFCDINEFYFLK